MAGQAGMALHTMAILQAYQADVLKEMDEGAGLTPEAVKELRRATDLALRATKHTARAVGRSMAGSVAAERHLWLNLTEIREKEKVFLLDVPSRNLGYLERRSPPTTTQAGWPEAARQACRFGSSESFLTLRSVWGELFQR